MNFDKLILFLEEQLEFPFDDPRRPGKDPLLVKLGIESWPEFDETEDWAGVISREELEEVYEKAHIEFELVDLGDENYMVGDDWIIDEDGEVTYNLADWIYSMSEMDAYALTKNFWKETDFWEDEVGDGSVCYHASPCENEESILKNGIDARNETRGISNRGTSSAVFASFDPESIDSYGDCVFEIDLGGMKRDGYMPRAGVEEPLDEIKMKSALAHKLGVDDYYEDLSSEGINEDTIVIWGSIPAKYVSRYGN